MALDNANFISELSIVDPPGTDPLSQGDDQIRTIKRATQQSFPLIAAAVNITDVQMNLMAIKNEINEFTARQDLINASLRFEASSDRGMQFTTGALLRWQVLTRLTGANDIDWIRYDALGDLLTTAMSLKWATGVMDFREVPTVQGAPIWVAGELRIFVVNTTPGTNWFVADGLNGTVNLDDRVLVAEGSSAVGTNLNPNLVGTAAANTTGSTAISEAQMPSHTHEHGQTQGTSNGTANSTNIEDQAVGTVADDPTRNFKVISEPRGGGGSHNHPQTSVGVTENGTDRNTVRSLSRTVQYHQYVP